MNNPLISVNLLLYKPGVYLKPCLESILTQSYKNFELLMTDNASGDETVERVKKILEDSLTTIKFSVYLMIQKIKSNNQPKTFMLSYKNHHQTQQLKI